MALGLRSGRRSPLRGARRPIPVAAARVRSSTCPPCASREDPTLTSPANRSKVPRPLPSPPGRIEAQARHCGDDITQCPKNASMVRQFTGCAGAIDSRGRPAMPNRFLWPPIPDRETKAHAHDRCCQAQADGECDPRARHGRRGEGEVRPPRHADGHGRRRHRPLHPLPEVRPRRPALAGPRPLRALRRPRLDAALRAPLPDRLPGDDARRVEALPPASLARRRAIRRVSSPPASRRPPGRSARAWPPPSAWRSPSACSRPSSATTSSTTAPSSSAPTAT